MRSLFVALALNLVPMSGLAQSYQAGLDAFADRNYVAALREWRPLAEQGDAAAQSRVGFLHERGLGVPRDDASAMQWYRLAAEQDLAEAQTNLGRMYQEGLGVPQDNSMALYWYLRAARQGDGFGQHIVGGLYLLGQGVPQDAVMAHMWFNLSAARTHINADFSAHMRDEIGRSLGSTDLSEAQRRARVCFASGYQDCN